MVLNMGLLGVGLGGPIASAAAMVFGLGFFLTGRWKKLIIHSVDTEKVQAIE